MKKKSSDFQLIDLALPYQRKFIESKKKKKIWLSSRQVGKSWSLAFIAAYKALQKRNALVLCVSTGARSASELIKKCLQMAEAIEKMTDGAVKFTSSADCVKFSNGGRILSLPSGNPSALRGYSAAAILIDEAAFIERPDEVFSAIAPTLTRDRDAELIVTSTPAGKDNFFYKLWMDADDEWHRQTTTIDDAIADGLKIDIEELKAIVKDPDVFDQEYRCKFSNSYSSLVDLTLVDYYDTCPSDAWTTYCGMDVGSTSDRTAIVTLRTSGDKQYVDDIVVMHKASYESQLGVLQQLHESNKYRAGYIDQNGIGSALAEFATKQVSSKIRGYTWTSANKTPAFEHFRAQIFDHKVSFSRRFKSMLEEDFSNMHRIVTETGKVLFEADRGKNGHSDVTSAIVLALQAAKETPTGQMLPVSYSFSSRF